MGYAPNSPVPQNTAVVTYIFNLVFCNFTELHGNAERKLCVECSLYPADLIRTEWVASSWVKSCPYCRK